MQVCGVWVCVVFHGRLFLTFHVCLHNDVCVFYSKPGTLLLNMLIKNEAEHLERTLPKWAKIIGMILTHEQLHVLNARVCVYVCAHGSDVCCHVVVVVVVLIVIMWCEDYWIIGVDDHNTDNSEEIIHKHLSHIPGRIVIVAFDGMGPTWTVLVEAGLKYYPQATHGMNE